MTDEQIVELYWARSETAIGETQKRYGRYCHSIAMGILRNGEDARETVNDAYLKAWDQIPPAKPAPFKSFLGRITRQLAIKRLEKAHAQKRGGGAYILALEELGECISDELSDRIVDRIALADALNRFLRALPHQTRQIFLMRYWYARSIGEIAKELGIGQSKVKMQLLRAREKLGEQLRKEELFP